MVKITRGAIRNGKVIDNEAKGEWTMEVTKISRCGRFNITIRT